MDLDIAAAILIGAGAISLLLGWALDRSDLKGRPALSVRRPRSSVSTVATVAGAAAMLIGLVYFSKYQ